MTETDTEIFLDAAPLAVPRRLVRGSRRWIKHVVLDGARFHVLAWSTAGRHCSEPDCVVNRDRARRAGGGGGADA